jgi:hypothetical protein
MGKPAGPARPGRALAPWGGEHVDVDRYWAEAWVDLHRRQTLLANKLKIGKANWTVNQEAGLIEFDRQDGKLVTAPVQIIGSWNPRTTAFTWGWDHPSVQTRLRADAERTRWFGDKHDLPELTERSLKISEQEAWRLTAVAMKVNAAAGAYRGPTDGPVVFMTLGAPKVTG